MVQTKKSKPQVIFVTGATGFVGQTVVRHLSRQGYNIRILVRKNTPIFGGFNVTQVLGDIRNYGSVLNAVDGITGIVHLAAAKSDEPDSYDTNVTGARNLINACKQKNVKFIINLSTTSSNLVKKGIYGKTKDLADRLFLNSGLKVITLKSSIIYGDINSGVFGSIVKFTRLPFIPIIGDGKTLFRPIHVDDVAKTIEIAINKIKNLKPEYDIGSAEPISFNALVSKISLKFTGRTPNKIHLPVWFGKSLAHFLQIISNKPAITLSNILGSTQDVKMNVNQYFQDFEFKPLRLDDGLNTTFELSRVETSIFYNYFFPSDKPIIITDFEIDLYTKALKINNLDLKRSIVHKNPSMLGYLDAASKIFYPNSNLQKKIRISAALVECHPLSSSWLLPQDRSLMRLIIETFKLTLSAIIKNIGGIILMLYPGFVKKNVEKI